jgi:hypothetical protein
MYLTVPAIPQMLKWRELCVCGGGCTADGRTNRSSMKTPSYRINGLKTVYCDVTNRAERQEWTLSVAQCSPL